jgi:subtilisin family serine protease
MQGADTGAESLGFCRRVSQEICKLTDFCRPLADSMRHDRHIRRRLLHIELLEGRNMMSAQGLSSLISSIWFQDCSTAEQLSHAGVATWTESSIITSSQSKTTSASSQSNTYDWIVQFDTSALGGITQLTQTASLLAGAGIEFQVIRGLGLEGMELVRSVGASFDTVTQWLSHNTYITGFEEDALGQIEKTANDPLMSQLWGMTKIDAADAWNLTTGATGANKVVVAVIDTGVDYTDTDLAANIWTNTAEIAGNGVDDDHDGFVDDIRGYNFVSNTNNVMDDNSHGTHVSGTIAAVGNNSLGVAGVNWSASIMPLKFLDSTGSGYLSDAVRAINYVTMMRTQEGVNVRVINASWGGGGYSSAMQNAIQAANDAGILFVAAAGNSATNNDASPQYPASYTPPNVISVAASDQNDRLASFSCYGATTVDLAAPGVNIYSTLPGNRYGAYSGTSMATPFVSGVAALAWAYNPNATVADVRNALLQGVDKVSSLSGKVASGGRLNAYNTLKLLGAGVSTTPVLGSLTATPTTVNQGTDLTLIGQGVSASKGISGVYFYQDINGNGVFDSSDKLVGTTKNVVNGTANLTVSTSNLAAGSYKFLARTLDANNQWSSAKATTVTILARDDFGNAAATAATINLNSTTSANIETGGDQDWFKFQAQAGRRYAIATSLTGLVDSVLTLYDPNGVTQLALNDNYGSSRASYIDWTAPASGTYFIKATASNQSQTGAYQLSLKSINSAPVLQTVADQTMSTHTDKLTIPLTASDVDGDPLTYSAQAYTIDPLAKKAYELDRQLGLYQLQGSYYTNSRGMNEKYLAGTGGTWYYILPNGNFYRWGGSFSTSTLIYSFNSSYYANPRLLFEAQAPAQIPVTNGSVLVSMSGNKLTIDPASGFTGDIYVSVTVGDNSLSNTKSFKVSVTNSAAASTTAATVGAKSINEESGLSSWTIVPNWSANLQTISNTAQLYEISSLTLQGNNIWRLPVSLSVDAVKSVYSENALHDNTWWSDELGTLRNTSLTAAGHIDGIQHNLIDGIAYDIFHASISFKNYMDNSSYKDYSKDIEDALTSLENRSSDTDVRDEIFALLSNGV